MSSTRGIYDRSASLTCEYEISCFVFYCQMQLSIVLDALANNKKPHAADNNQKSKTGQYSVRCRKYFRRIRSNIWFTRCNFVASDTNCVSSLVSVECKFLKLCHFISKLLALVIHKRIQILLKLAGRKLSTTWFKEKKSKIIVYRHTVTSKQLSPEQVKSSCWS